MSHRSARPLADTTTPTPVVGPRREPTRHPGLDALRAVALTAVILFHVAPTAVPGGYAGVDVFFVISGFLITDLMLREHEASGTVRLGMFAARRARRLIPAAMVLVLVATSCAVVLGGDVLVGLPAQLLGMALFVTNWQMLLGGVDYFHHAGSGLFDNFWSLAIEEQFYVVWPLVLVLLVLAGRTVRAGCLWAAGALAAAVPLVLSSMGMPDAAYLATPSHAFGLLAGAALAASLRQRQRQILPAAGAARARCAWVVTGCISLVGFGWLVVSPVAAEPSARAAVTVLGAALGSTMVLVCVRSGGRLLAHVDEGPLGWVGRRSYGLYLWHLPMVVLAASAVRGGDAWQAATGTLAAIVVSVVAAAASYRWVELPVMRRGFRLTLQRPAVAMLAVVLVIGLGASTAAAVHADPGRTEAQRLVEEGSAGLGPRGHGGTTTPTTPGPGGGVQLAPRPSPVVTPQADAPATEAPTAQPDLPSGGVDGASVVAVGDSVMLASGAALQQAFPGIAIDAAVSRQLPHAAALIRRLLADRPAARVVIIALGTNGVGTSSDLAEAIDAAGTREVVLVDVAGPMSWTSSVNEMVHDAARDRPNVRVAGWRAEAMAHPGLLARDGIHPGRRAADLYASAIGRAIDSFR
ncbi:peptidoglycan/LPS O-acetylase OafA/YrhL [Clavibacter sp. B3I6]|uniref:acyltransferase family protein n=1 Tax=Clavibacter sp. B3I6 TaxID=3042268 RepID=UPI00278A5778|nr:acyltransferase family protein [Clavibacter sp. B3I6]MDQ0743027.1 peptidoglycan/LPS O-acetylase OafA/YrhL [Clavibacter sp. B3I6]